MKRTFTFLMTALFLCVGMTVKAQHWLQPTVSTDKETYEYYIANYRNGDYFVTSTKGLSGGVQQLGSANAFDDTKAKVTFKLVEGGKLWSTNTATPLILGYTTTDGSANSVQLFAKDSKEGYTWKIEYSSNGGNTLCAGSSDNSWNMHGGAGENIGLYGKTDGGSNWVFIPANDAAVAKAAEAIAEYAPSTEFYYQIKNVKHSRMLAANATNATSISTNSTADLNQLWAFEKGEDGAFYLRNAGQEKYLVAASSNNTAWTVGAEGSAFEVELLDIKKVNYALHAVGQDEYGNAHDANWGTDAQVVRWLASAEASQWYLEKTEISTKAVGISLVYSLTYNGEEKFTHTCTGFVGEAYPEVNVALPFGIVATKPAGELTADVAGKVVEVKLSDNLPFAYAADVKSVENWYYLLFHATGKNYLYYAADDAVLEANKTAVDTNDKDAYAWAFVGNPFDGFKVYNKKAGKFLDAAKDGAVVTAAGEQVFTLTASPHGTNGFYMQAKDGEYKERFNKQSDKVVYWSGADVGSTFMVWSEITYELTDALGNTYTGAYEGVAGTDKPTLSGVAGYTLSNEAWNGTTYTANIAFPFPVSNAEITNPLMIGSHNSEAFLWRAEGTGITVLKDATADSDNYKWAIYPAFSEGNFTFTIKNLGTGKYINSTSAENSHAEGAVTLADEGTAFTVEANNKFKLATGKFLSVNSSKDDKVQIVGTWGEHGGVYNKFVAVAVEVASVTLDKTEAILTEAGATVTLVATVAPVNATNKTVTWESSNTEVATVDANGVVTAVANGKATITATVGEKTATCEVTVAIPEVEYADAELINAFIAEVVAIGELPYDLEATWASLPAVLAALEALNPVIEQLEAGEPVVKTEVESATATVANAKAVATYYNETYLPTAKAATELLAALENGSAEHTALSAAIAACDLSAVTTVAELETMEAALAEAVEANTPEGGLVKTDYTDAIKNAAVTSKDEWNAEGASFGTPEKKDELVKYGSGKLVDFNQTITIPAGKYKMTAKAVYRYTGSEQSEYEAIQAGTNTHLAKLYAETSSCKYETNVMNRWEGASDTDYAAGNGSVTVNGKFVPNSSAAVKAWFDNGMYVNELVFNVQADGEVKIGIETKETVPGGEYTNISAWTLTRLGDAEADPNDYTDAIKNAAVTSKDEWNAEGASFGTPEKKDELVKYGSGKLVDFNQTITIPAGKYKMTAKAVYRYTGSEQSEYEAIQAGTNTHLAKFYAQTATYKYETNVMNRWEGASDTDYAAGNGSVTVNGKFVPNSSAAVKAWFDNGMYVNELVFNVQADGEVKIGIETKETVPGGEYTNISSWTLRRIGDAEADPKPVEVVFKPGQDATFMIENAQVTSASGWVNGSANKDQQYTGAPDNTYLDWCNWSGKVETMDMHQVVPNMPAGYYTLKVATRAHNKMNGVVYAITDVDTYSTEIHHVDNVGNELGGGWGWTVVEGFAMAARGNMTIGFKVTAPEDGVWAGADNFMLTYLGATELEVAQYEFLTVKDQFDLMSTGIYQVMYVGRMGAAYEALSEKVWALASKEDATAEEYKACVAEMKAVMADIEAAEDYYVNVFSPLANECFEVQDNSVAKSEEAAEAFAEACDKMGWSGTMGVATVADLEAIVAEVQPALNAYVLNAIPINGVAFNYSFFLTNPSFETGNIDGWTVGSSADTGVRENAGGYATANGDGDYLFNTWWQGVMLSQEAEGLPNGNYRLTASLASGDGGKAATIFLVANGEKKGFTMDHKGEFEDCSIEFKVTDGKVSIATIGGNDDASYNENGHWWYKSDNYRIHYLGDGGVTGVSLWTKETYYDEWAKEDVQYDLEWDMPELTEIGATFKFEVSVEAPEDADTTIVWSVSNDKVLSIDQTGLLTVIGSGSGFYEVMATAPNGISATCKVKVEAFQEGDITEMEIVYEGGWWIESTMAGETFQLGVEYNEDATNVDLVWSSTNEKVATVDQNGLVTIVGSGEADIVVTASSGVQASISVVAEISEEDGIDNKSVEADAVIYDIHGRRVEKMTKGLYIVNGRKVMVK